MRIYVPPIKSQGIKTKLVPWIEKAILWERRGRWVEPFLGSGVVGFNIRPPKALFCDSNPHIIDFYAAIKDGLITPSVARIFLEEEGAKLQRFGAAYYYEVRERFNVESKPLDFLFLNRSCFNGIIRFNSRGEFNVPFGHKPMRFSRAYITKIVNQIKYVYDAIQQYDWEFRCQSFTVTLHEVRPGDFVYCDPPYIGRHVDYYNGWDETMEQTLYCLLKDCPTSFMLSTWCGNHYRQNPYVDTLWSQFHVLTKEHHYHVGGKEVNRNPMIEALVLNYLPPKEGTKKDNVPLQSPLF